MKEESDIMINLYLEIGESSEKEGKDGERVKEQKYSINSLY